MDYDPMGLAYAAGLFDGEGSVMLCRTHRYTYRSPYVSMSSTSPELVLFMKEMFGGTIVKHKTYQDHHLPSQAWHVSYDAAIRCMEAMRPYIREAEKIRRIDMILSEYKALTPRNGKYTKEAELLRLDFEERFFAGKGRNLSQRRLGAPRARVS